MTVLMERSTHIECNKCSNAIRFATISNVEIADVTPDEFNTRACDHLESNGWQQQPNHAWLCPAHKEGSTL